MSDRFAYLYVMIDTFGNCRQVREHETEKSASLPELLADGWRPIRETPFSGESSILITLERESREADAFGFGTS